MEIKNIFTDENAVSPVIGVILMVAITVILAAVIGAFVLGIGGSQEQVPQASWSATYGTDGSGNNQITLSHDGGGELDGDTLSVIVKGTTVYDADGSGDPELESGVSAPSSSDDWTGEEVSAGDSLVLNDDADAASPDFEFSGEVQIVWSSPSSDSSQVLFTSQVP